MRKIILLLLSIVLVSCTTIHSSGTYYGRVSCQKIDDDYFLLAVRTEKNPKHYNILEGVIWDNEDSNAGFGFLLDDCSISYDKNYLYVRVNTKKKYNFTGDYRASVAITRGNYFFYTLGFRLELYMP